MRDKPNPHRIYPPLPHAIGINGRILAGMHGYSHAGGINFLSDRYKLRLEKSPPRQFVDGA